MHKTTFDKLISTPEVYYIYDLRGNIFGIDNKLYYLIVIADNYIINDICDESEIINVTIYTISEWFKAVMNCEILPWICACADKKYVIKEHVKLMMTTEPLKLRKNYDKFKTTMLNEHISDNMYHNKLTFWEILRDLKFTNQIIENHKIPNLKITSEDFSKLNNCESLDLLSATFAELAINEVDLLRKNTDGLIYKEKLKKWEQSKKS